MKKIYALVMTVAFAVAVTPAVMESEPAKKTEAVKADVTKAATPADIQKKKVS